MWITVKVGAQTCSKWVRQLIELLSARGLAPSFREGNLRLTLDGTSVRPSKCHRWRVRICYGIIYMKSWQMY